MATGPFSSKRSDLGLLEGFHHVDAHVASPSPATTAMRGGAPPVVPTRHPALPSPLITEVAPRTFETLPASMQRPQPVVLADDGRDRDVAPADQRDDQWTAAFRDDALPIRVRGSASLRPPASGSSLRGRRNRVLTNRLA